MRRVAVLILVSTTIALAACTSSDGTSSDDDARRPEVPDSTGPHSDTTAAAGTGTPLDGDLPAATDTTVAVSLPPVDAQPEPTAARPGNEAAAQRFAQCVADGSCREVEARLVAWPGAALPGIDLSHGQISGADLRGADLSGSDLNGADLSGANLAGAKLDGADLRGADLSGATLIGASVRGVDLVGATLFEALVDGASFRASLFCQTTWIDGRELNDLC